MHKNDITKTVLDLSHKEACKCFMEIKNYCTLNLPEYFDFKPILEYVKKTVYNKSLDTIQKSKQKPSLYDNVNYKVLYRKDSLYSYRPLQLVNPYLYYLIVREITRKEYWKEIQNHFKNNEVSKIDVASLPKVKDETDKSHKASEVNYWWNAVEQQSLEKSIEYRYMFVTDITNCYASIYTHTIAWAVMGKDEAKKNRCRQYIGNILDNLIREMQNGQTNGIPQGSTLFDFIAEIILTYADKKLSDKLSSKGITDYYIIRYRDDYRIFSNNKREIETISFTLQEILHDINLQLNANKTFLTEDIITNSIKKDKITYIYNNPLCNRRGKFIYSSVSSIEAEAIFIHQFASKYPNSGTLSKLLMNFAKRLNNRNNRFDNLCVLVAIFTSIAIDNPKKYSEIIMIISKIINKMDSMKEKKTIIKRIQKKISDIPNIGEVELWLQRMSINIDSSIEYSEKLCKIVSGADNIEIWNIDWVKDEYKKDFPINSIVDNSKIKGLSPEIYIKEVSLFGYK